jgi:hypothetical protein
LSYDDHVRNFPSLPRAIAAVITAAAIPTLIFVQTNGVLGDIKNPSDLRDLAMVLAFYVGQSVIIAIPIALFRWRRMSRPLLECMVLGALLAPGPLGYFGILVAAAYNPIGGFRFFFILALLGALGGFLGWAVATRLGREMRELDQ